MDIQNISLKELKPYVLNAKKHPPEQIEKLVRSINLTGFDQPIVVNKEDDEYVIVKGHGRYLASLQMNLKTVPCMVLELPKIVADQARLMDNKSAESDYDIELLIKELSKFNSEEIIETGYDETELNKLILELEDTLGDLENESSPEYKDLPKDTDIDNQLRQFQENIKKGILIEFEVEDHPKALQLVNKARKQDIYVGKLLLDLLINELGESGNEI